MEKIGIKSYFLTNNMRNKTYLVTHQKIENAFVVLHSPSMIGVLIENLYEQLKCNLL